MERIEVCRLNTSKYEIELLTDAKSPVTLKDNVIEESSLRDKHGHRKGNKTIIL